MNFDNLLVFYFADVITQLSGAAAGGGETAAAHQHRSFVLGRCSDAEPIHSIKI